MQTRRSVSRSSHVQKTLCFFSRIFQKLQKPMCFCTFFRTSALQNASLGPPLDLAGASDSPRRAPAPTFEPTRAPLGSSRALLGSSRALLGAPLGSLWASLDSLGLPWGLLGSLQRPSRSPLGPPGSLQRQQFWNPEPILDRFWDH